MADFDPEAFVSENSPKNGADSFDPAAFVLEPSTVDSSRPKEMGMGFAAIEGLADAVPGTSQVGAALRGGLPALGDAIDDPLNGKKWGRIVSEYQRVKGEQEARSRKAQNDAPWAYGLSNVLGSVGTAVAGGAAGKMLLAPASAAQATQLAIPGALVGNEAMNIGARYNSGTEQIGGGVGGDQMVGFLASKVIHGVAGAATRQVIPLVLKMPQAMQEKFFYAIGDTRLAKLLADNADTPAGKMLSERVRGLQGKIAAAGSVPEVPFTPLDETTIDAADAVGLKLAKAARAGMAEVGEGVNYSLKPESGLIDDMAALSKGTTDAAAEKQWPGQSRETPFKSREVVAESNLEKARAAGADEEGRIFGGDVALGQFGGLAEIEAALGGPAGPITKFEQASGRYSQDSVIARAQAREAQEEIGRSIGTREKYREFFDGVDVSIGHELRQREAEAAAAMGKTGAPVAKSYDGEGLSLDAAKAATDPPKMSIADANRVSKESRDTLARVKAGMSEATVNRKVQTEEVLDSARHWQQKLAGAEKQMAAAGANKFERERLQGIAAEAQRELTRINTGRRATERVLGAQAGYGAGGIAGGLYGFEKGLPIGRSADMMADVGSRLQQWATRNDNLGRAAQWAIQAPGEARLARIIALSNMPEAQEEIGLER